MAFDPTINSFDYQVLVEIALAPAYTLRVSLGYVTLDDGTAYEGLLANISPLRRTVGPILDPRMELPSVRLLLDNKADSLSGERVQDLVDLYEWGNKDVIIKIGKGRNAADFSTVFNGKVLFPGGVNFNDTILTVRVNDLRATDARTLPPNTYNRTTYPRMEEKSVGLRIPLVYGDWQRAAGNGEKVQGHQIDSAAGTGGRFKFADHSLKSIEAVYKNGVDITANCTLDAANAECTITSGTYAAADTLSANVQGATDDGLTSGDMVETLPDIADDILQTWLSVPAASINAAALTAWGAALGAIQVGRRVISDATDSKILLAELLSEGFADLIISGGQYTIIYRIRVAGEALDTYRAEDIITGADGVKRFEVTRDPERVYTNEVAALYSYDPANSRYTEAYTTFDTGAIEAAGTRQQRLMSFKWLYDAAPVQSRVDLELYTFGIEPETIDVELSPAGALREPADQFRLIYNKYGEGSVGGTLFQVRSVVLSPATLQPQITAWSQIRLAPHVVTSNQGEADPVWHITEDSAPAWGAATAVQRVRLGFVTDNAGEAAPGDPASVGSVVREPVGSIVFSDSTTAARALNAFVTNDQGEADPVWHITEDSAPAWGAATAAQRVRLGFVTDNAGEAAPGDPASVGSVVREVTIIDPESFVI